MKITIEIDECADYGLPPTLVYKRLYTEYHQIMCRKHNKDIFLSLETWCDGSARNLYAEITGRHANVKNLILTYKDAENVFNLFKQFADVWVKNYMEGKQ